MPISLAHIPPALAAAATVAGGLGVLLWRVRETATPVSTRKIVIPPLGMSTGFFMFLAPPTRVPWAWAATAFAIGALVLAIPLERTSTLVRKGDVVVMERSRAFLWILLGLFAIRLVAHEWIEQYVTTVQTGAIFFILAFGMILRWRVGMLREFLRLKNDGAALSS